MTEEQERLENIGTYLRPEVQQFARAMERKLRENDHKRSWKDCTLDYLYRALEAEIHELQAALILNRPAAVLEELADVANLGMMLCDNLGLLKPESPREEDIDEFKQRILHLLGSGSGQPPEGVAVLDIGADLFVKSRRSLENALAELVDAGMIRRTPGTESYRIVERAPGKSLS